MSAVHGLSRSCCGTLSPATAAPLLKQARRQTNLSLRMLSTVAPKSADPFPVPKSTATDHPTWSEYNQRWFDIWQAGLEPGQLFDKGSPSPQLLQLLSSGILQVQGKRALVPGCGRGYDVTAFALAGAAAAVGLDICPVAVAAAAAERDKELVRHEQAAKIAAATELLVDDFFTYTHSSGQPFDIGYDYTFLCALHPDMRPAWAKRWGQLLAPGGELITMVYPVDGSMDVGSGPPWPVTPDLYKQLLLPAGFELLSLEPIPANLSHQARQGREWLGRWRWSGSSSSSEQQ